MERRQRALERHADRLRQYLKTQIERTGMGEIKNHYLALRIQNNPPSVVVDDEKSIPAEYKRIETVTTLLRAEIARALKADQEVPGSHLQRSTRLVIQ
jgi:Gp157 protein